MFDLADKSELRSSIRNIQSTIESIHTKLETISNPTLDTSSITSRLSNIELRIKEIGTKSDKNAEIESIRGYVEDIQSMLIDTVCPSIEHNSLLDASPLFTGINNSIIATTQKLCELNTNISVLKDILTKLDEISNKIIVPTEQIPNKVLINYPRNDVAAITSGYTILDFYTGTVTNADGLTDTMSDSIENYQESYIKSFVIYADRKIDLSIIGNSSCVISLPAGTFRLAYGEVTRLKIYATSDTNIWVSGSFVPNGAPNLSPSSVDSTTQPNSIIAGSKTNISTTASQITTVETLINKVVTVKVRSLGGGTYIALGNSTTQSFRLTAIGDSHDIDYIDDLVKIYCITDGSNASIEWIGG